MRTKTSPGEKFGLLTVLEYIDTKKTVSKSGRRTHHYPTLNCKCICGKEVIKFRRYLVNGHGQQCGSENCRRMARWLVRESKKLTTEAK